MKYPFLLGVVVSAALLGAGCSTGVDQPSAVQLKSEPVQSAPAQSAPSLKPMDIPPLKVGHIDESKDLSPLPKVEFQPEKLLNEKHISQISESAVKSYFKELGADGWKLIPAVNLMGTNMRKYRAEKGDYIVEMETSTYGKDTAYSYILLSASATEALPN